MGPERPWGVRWIPKLRRSFHSFGEYSLTPAMPLTTHVELVETATEDGLTLHGALHQRHGAPVPSAMPVDSILLLHGVGSNFYSSPLLTHLAQQFAKQGLTTLCANTRGHDFVSLARTVAGPQRQGAAYETVGQCRYDIAAWNEFLCGRGAQRIGVVGHSLGAIKAVYATVLHPHRATSLVVAISPPRLSYVAFQNGPRKILFQRTMARAQAHIDQGKPEALMRVKYPFPLLITAAGYLEKYGPAERYNLLEFANQLPCPALFTYGELEIESGSVSFTGLPEALQGLPRRPKPLETITVAGANHLYEGCLGPLAGKILDWLARRLDREAGDAR